MSCGSRAAYELEVELHDSARQARARAGSTLELNKCLKMIRQAVGGDKGHLPMGFQTAIEAYGDKRVAEERKRIMRELERSLR